MASLADLATAFQPAGPPAGFQLADLELQRGLAQAGAGIQRQRLLRDFQRFDLPDLVSAQAARGAFRTGATKRKTERLATGVADRLADVDVRLASLLGGIAFNQQLAGTGAQLGGFQGGQF